MTKSPPYIMVSLEDSESKALAQVLSNDTSRAIMKHLAGNDSATETEIATALGIPLSTAHYNIQNLVNANLVKPVEFHYSERGKRVLHYTLSNKLIIIAPRAEKRFNLLKRILPVASLIGIMSLGIGLLRRAGSAPQALTAREGLIKGSVAAPACPNPVLWFVGGALITLIAYIALDAFLRKK